MIREKKKLSGGPKTREVMCTPLCKKVEELIGEEGKRVGGGWRWHRRRVSSKEKYHVLRGSHHIITSGTG